jgi:hypothetical protein
MTTPAHPSSAEIVAPDDYQRILEWFPLAELEFFRRDLSVGWPP